MPEDFEVDAEIYDGVDIEQITTNSLDAVAVDVQTTWQELMDDAGYRNTGETINSITWEATSEFVRRIGSDRVAALIAEFGRAPGAGFPPPDDLADWVHEQDDLPSRGETVEWSFDRWRGGEAGPQTLSFDDVVFIIGRAINETGLPAYHFGERAAREHDDTLEEEIQRRLDAALEGQAID